MKAVFPPAAQAIGAPIELCPTEALGQSAPNRDMRRTALSERIRNSERGCLIDGRWFWRRANSNQFQLLPPYLFDAPEERFQTFLDELKSLSSLPVEFYGFGAAESGELELAENLEDRIISGNFELSDLPEPKHPRLLFALGLASLRAGNTSKARQYFHSAMLAGHPAALEAEWYCISLQFQSFRQRYPEVCAQVDQGEGLVALNLLRNLVRQGEQDGRALLAYCLRSANEPEEGIALCKELLEEDALQSDVYGHLVSFLIQKGLDEEAYEAACSHRSRYPFTAQAYTDLLDTSLLLGKEDEAAKALAGYLAVAENNNLAAKNSFKFFEERLRLADGKNLLGALISVGRKPTATSLVYFGECQIEADDPAAASTLERALEIEPGNSECVAAYARMLARKGELSAAAKFLASVLHDPNRIDSLREQLLLKSLLSEVLRHLERFDESVGIWEELCLDASSVELCGPAPLIEATLSYLSNNELRRAKELGFMLRSYQQDGRVVELMNLLQGLES